MKNANFARVFTLTGESQSSFSLDSLICGLCVKCWVAQVCLPGDAGQSSEEPGESEQDSDD